MEFLDIVNEHDEVVGRASKDEVYARLLTHRIVHVLVFNPQGEILLQKRSSKVSFAALHWCTSVGGHVQCGETYEQAAQRETKEEIGVDLKLAQAFKDYYLDPRGVHKFLTTFTGVHEGPFTQEQEAIEELRFVPLETVWEMVHNGESFHPEFLYILNKRYS